jgi:thiosulfate/3-mercaptopyruvate sulfurtransferase
VICRKSHGPLISVDELSVRMGNPRLRIIDCRFDLMNPDAGHESYLAGHIPGAVFADLDTDLAAPVDATTGRHPLPDPEVLAGTFRRLGVNHDTPVVVYDGAGGAMAARAWWSLRWLGHTDVTLLDGGLPCWQAAKEPLEEGEIAVEPGDFTGAPREGLVLTTGEVLTGLEEGDLVLVDARDRARFRVPGTRNLPFTEALSEDGTFRPQGALEALWRDVLGHPKDKAWSVMCGSGVTACHLAISGLLAGYREPSVYVGSWSEWIRDPGRPVATETDPDR